MNNKVTGGPRFKVDLSQKVMDLCRIIAAKDSQINLLQERYNRLYDSINEFLNTPTFTAFNEDGSIDESCNSKRAHSFDKFIEQYVASKEGESNGL